MKVIRLYRSYSKKESTGNYGSVGSECGIEVELEEGEDFQKLSLLHFCCLSI